MSLVAIVILVDKAAERSGFWCVSLRRSDGHLLELLVRRSEIHAILPGIGTTVSRRPRAASSDRCHDMLGGQLLRLVLDPPMECRVLLGDRVGQSPLQGSFHLDTGSEPECESELTGCSLG